MLVLGDSMHAPRYRYRLRSFGIRPLLLLHGAPRGRISILRVFDLLQLRVDHEHAIWWCRAGVGVWDSIILIGTCERVVAGDVLRDSHLALGDELK